MRRLGIIGLMLVLVRLLTSSATAAHVSWTYQSSDTTPQGLRSASLYPSGTFTNGAGAIITRDRVSRTTDATGQLIISNVYGGDFRVELQGTFTVTTNWYRFPVTNGLINAADYITAPTNGNTGYRAYTTAESDGRYLGRAGDDGSSLTNVPESGVSALPLHLSQRISTNDARAVSLSGTVTLNNRLTITSLYGFGSEQITWQTNQGPGGLVYGGYFSLLAPSLFNGISGFRWMDQFSTNTWFTVGNNQNTGNYDPIPRSYNATYVVNTNASQQLGVSEYCHFPYVGGSGATLSGLPVHGQEIWSRMPIPPIVFTTWTPSLDGTNNCNEAYVSNVVRNLNLDGLVAACTNKGIPVMIDINAGWHSARDGSGYQTWNTTLFPHGIPFLVNYCHTNAGRYVQLELHQYFSGRDSNNWFSVSPSYVQTPSTVNLAPQDFYQFFTWGLDSVLIADGAQEDASGSPGFAQLMTRQVCQELLYPGGIVPSLKSFTNLISFNCFLTRIGPLGVGQSLVTPGAAYEINRWQDDQGNQGGPNPGVAIDKAMFQSRLTWTNYAQYAGKGHYFSAVYPTDVGVINNADLQAELAMGVMFPAGTTFYTNNPSVAILQSLTNSVYLDVFSDANQDPAFPAFDNGSGSTSAWVKPMSGGRFAVVLGNETASAQTITLNWNQIISPRNFMPVGTTTYPFSINPSQAYVASDIWNSTNMGTFQGNFSPTVASHTAGFYLFTPVTLELARAKILTLFNTLSIFGNGSESASPQFWEDGFSIGSVAGGFSYSVPTWTTQATVTCKMQASAVTAWTNTALGFWSVNGADGRDWNTFTSSNIVTSANPSITNFTFTVTWPVTNTVKYFRLTIGACTNSATRSFATPLQITYQ